jgi:Flp pilus assembly protein TadG
MTDSRRFTQSQSESGQSMLELAVCLPLFALLILGGAEIANIAWASIILNNAAHAGAQFASHNRGWAAQIGNIEQAARNEAPGLTLTFPSDPVQACSCVDATGSPAGTGCQTTTECPSPNTILDNITVRVRAVVTPLIHYPGLPASYTLNAQATMGVVN